MRRRTFPGLLMGGLIVLMISALSPAGTGSAQTGDTTKLDPLVEEILDRVEQRYVSSAFTARFRIESTLKAMEVTDTAAGRLFVAYPGKMRWEYDEPDPMLFVTDGETLWMYQPLERQVTVGKANEVLGGSQGASFLSDIRLLRREFEIELDPNGSDDAVRLKLTPLQAAYDIDYIIMTVNRSTNEVVEVLTVNPYGDRTRIAFHDIAFQQSFAASLFQFDIPEGVDVLQF